MAEERIDHEKVRAVLDYIGDGYYAPWDPYIKEIEDAVTAPTRGDIAALVGALHFTVEYVGYAVLPAIDGWSWYDALKRYDPDLAAHHRAKYEEWELRGTGRD